MSINSAQVANIGCYPTSSIARCPPCVGNGHSITIHSANKQSQPHSAPTVKFYEVRFGGRTETFIAAGCTSEKWHHPKSVDLSITSSAYSSSTKHLGFMSKRPARFSSSSSHNIAPIVIRSHFWPLFLD